MILPSDSEHFSARGVPWLTCALLVAMLAGFGAMRGGQGFISDSTEVSPASALELWLAHPYLKLDPALASEALRSAPNDGYESRMAEARANAKPDDVDTARRADLQNELDSVTRLALRGTDSLPGPNHRFRRYGWIPAEPCALALATHLFLHEGVPHLVLAILLLWL